MQKEWIMGYSTTILERAEILKVPADKEILAKWKARKSLLTDNDFKKMLETTNLTEEYYSRGLVPLNEKHLKKLFSYVCTKKWYKLHCNLFNSDIPIGSTLKTALRYHINHYKIHIMKSIRSNTYINMDNTTIDNLAKTFENDLSSIASKTLVWDMHETKKRLGIDLKNKEEEFNVCLKTRFGSIYNIKNFFIEYPTLAKLLAIRLEFFLDNFNLFINNVIKHRNIISKTFNVSLPFNLHYDHTSQGGDSHNGGKSTILFSINGKKMVYKYHDAAILTAYNSLLILFKELSNDHDFFIIKHVSGSDFSIEEFVEYTTCHSESEIRKYYTNYGKLVAISYFLQSYDLHMENLIAHGIYPVIVDTETIISNNYKRTYDSVITKDKIKDVAALTFSGLLPLSHYWKRKIEISALSGQKQKLPFKVRRLINEHSSDIKYELSDLYTADSCNIPKLNGKRMQFKPYSQDIINGFNNMSHFLIIHKSVISSFINDAFDNIHVRVLLRDTQDYANFISFAAHPSCMVDYIEREKVFENIWNHSFDNPVPITHEVLDLLNNDIPYFRTNTSSNSLNVATHTYLHAFNYSALDTTLTHINKLSKKHIENARLLISESLDILHPNYHKITMPTQNSHIKNKYLQQAADIGDLILDNVECNHEYNLVIWSELQGNHDSQFISLEYPDSNLYNGTCGLLIFFTMLNFYTSKSSYKEILYILEKEVFSSYTDSPITSAYYGIGGALSSAIILYEFTGHSRFYKLIIKYINYIVSNIIPDNREWLSGNASLLAILVRLYNIHPLPIISEAIHKIIPIYKELEEYKSYSLGFAHGLSGILYALNKYTQSFIDHDILLTIQYIKNILADRYSYENHNDSWCKGNMGILYTTNNVNLNLGTHSMNNYFNGSYHKSQNSCLCHGHWGVIDPFISSGNPELKISNEYNLFTTAGLFPLGMYTGLTGIGYQLLRLYKPSKIPSILFL